jgi:hypothetical protein
MNWKANDMAIVNEGRDHRTLATFTSIWRESAGGRYKDCWNGKSCSVEFHVTFNDALMHSCTFCDIRWQFSALEEKPDRFSVSAPAGTHWTFRERL